MHEGHRTAIEYAAKSGFKGDNPEVVAGMLFALADILVNAGYTFGDIAIMYRNVSDCLDKMHDATNYAGVHRTRTIDN